MARATHLETMNADNAHLPTVSVFIVLLAMMAALTSYTTPSKNNFQAAKLSLFDTFSAPDIGVTAPRRRLPLWLTQELNQLCTDFTVDCKTTQSNTAEGTAFLFNADAFDATLSGLTPKEQKFINALAAICANKPLRLTISLPFKTRMDTANILVLSDLFKKGSGSKLDLAVLQSEVLQDIPSFGFLVEPKEVSS